MPISAISMGFFKFIFSVILLCLIGVLITGSIGNSRDVALDKNIVIICVAIVLGIICHKLPSIHLYLIRFAPWILFLVAIPLCYLAVASLFSRYYLADTSTWFLRPKEINGSVRWLNFAGFSIQVGEFAKLAICLFMAYICQKNYVWKKEFLRGFIIPLAPCVIIAGLILVSNSKSMTFICVSISLTTLFIYGVRSRYIYLTVMLVVMIFSWVVANDTNKVNRIYSWWNSVTANYNYIDYGTQAGQSIAVFSYEPNELDFTKIDLLNRVKLAEKHNDFIFALVGHQLGIFSILVIIAYLCFFSSCMIIMREAVTMGGKILSFSLGFSLISVAVINLSVVTGLIPVTGVTAPFLSAGGSNLIASLLSVCLLINVRAMTIQKISDEKLQNSLAINEKEVAELKNY